MRHQYWQRSMTSDEGIWFLSGQWVKINRHYLEMALRYHFDAHVEQIHHNDVIMGAMASQITSLTIVYSTFYSGADQRKHQTCYVYGEIKLLKKHQSSASLAFVLGIHRWPVNSPHRWPVTRKMFSFDDVVMFIWLLYVTPAWTGVL